MRLCRSLLFVLLSLLAFAAVPASAAKKTKALSVRVVAKPAVVNVGDRATIWVAVRGLRGKRLKGTATVESRTSSRGRYRALTPQRFTLRSVRKRTASTRVAVVYRAPAVAGVRQVRVRLRVGRRARRTAAFRITVTPRRGGDSLVPAVSPPPTPGPRTQVVAPGVVRSVPAPGTAGEVRLSGVVDLKPGDYLATGIGDAAPYGFLGRVVAVRHEGDSTVLSSEPATLPEALPEGDLGASFVAEEIETPREDQRRRGDTGDSGAPSTSSGRGQIRIRSERAIECGASGEVTVKAVVGVRPEVDLSARWRLFKAPDVRFVGRLIGTSEISAVASAQASCTLGPVELFKKTLKPIQFSVGPVPVVIVPVVRVTLKGIGKVEGSLKSEVAGSITAEAGIEYENGSARPVGGIKRNFGYTPPTPDAAGELGATVSPTLDALLYGAGGPSVALNVGLKAEVEPLADVRWRLLMPLSLTAKLHAPVLKVSTGDLTVYSREFVLAQDEEGGGGGEGSPVDGGGGERAGLPLTFDDLPTFTTVTDEYRSVGIRFTSGVMTSPDGSNPTAPVLSGEPRFQGPIEAEFVDPATGAPATVARVQFDAGYIDSPGSVEIVATTASGRTIRAIADDEGIDEIFIAAHGIRSFVARTVFDEPAGFAIDNLDFG